MFNCEILVEGGENVVDFPFELTQVLFYTYDVCVFLPPVAAFFLSNNSLRMLLELSCCVS